jgi:hypothetical protein
MKLFLVKNYYSNYLKIILSGNYLLYIVLWVLMAEDSAIIGGTTYMLISACFYRTPPVLAR